MSIVKAHGQFAPPDLIFVVLVGIVVQNSQSLIHRTAACVWSDAVIVLVFEGDRPWLTRVCDLFLATGKIPVRRQAVSF